MEEIKCNLPEGLELVAGSLDTGGVRYGERQFVKDALVAAGAVITDAGFGCGGADLGFKIPDTQSLGDRQFSLAMKVRS